MIASIFVISSLHFILDLNYASPPITAELFSIPGLLSGPAPYATPKHMPKNRPDIEQVYQMAAL
jgi:hypothetical protein